MKRFTEVLIFLSFLLIAGCKKMPAGFWSNYDLDDLKGNMSDQGPYGGYRAMYWEKKGSTFQENNVLRFAEKNGWKLIEVKSIDSSITNKWVCNNKLIFPLDNDGLHIVLNDTSGFNRFPRWIKSPCRLYKFDSGWITVSHDKDKTAYGYILLSSDDHKMSMYHLWGE